MTNHEAVLYMYETSGLTKTQFVKRAGISRQALYDWITGKKTKVYPQTVVKVARAFEMKIDWLARDYKECELTPFKELYPEIANAPKYSGKDRRPDLKNLVPVYPLDEVDDYVGLNENEETVWQTDDMISVAIGRNFPQEYGIKLDYDTTIPSVQYPMRIIVSKTMKSRSGDLVITRLKETRENILANIYFEENKTITLKQNNCDPITTTIKEIEFLHRVIWIRTY